MPNQSDIQTTILNGEYSLGILTNNNLTIVNSGGLEIKQSFIQWFRLNLQALQDQFNIGDYVSVTTQTIYDRINGFIGIPYNATLDPNYQAPNTTIIIDGGGGTASFQYMNKTQDNLVYDAGIDSYYLPFLNNSGVGFPIGSVPISILLNGVQMEPALNTGFVPQRIYGFANNAPTQIITVTVAVP